MENRYQMNFFFQISHYIDFDYSALAAGGAVALGGAAIWYYTRKNKNVSSKGAKAISAQKSSAPMTKAKRLKEEGNTCFKKSQYSQAVAMYGEAIAACGPNEKEDLAMIYQNRAAAYEKMV